MVVVSRIILVTIHVTKYIKVGIFIPWEIRPSPLPTKTSSVNSCDTIEGQDIFYSMGNSSIPAPHQTLTTTTVKMAKALF